MNTRTVDVAIVGQGLAGTALAWVLHWRGLSTFIVDRDHPGTASRVAAGLMTPITGQRVVVSLRWHEMWEQAISFYDRVARELGSTVFHPIPSVRWLTNADEVSHFRERRDQGVYSGLIEERHQSPLDSEHFPSIVDWFEMRVGGRLDVSRYLSESRDKFSQSGVVVSDEFDPGIDLESEEDCVRLPRWDVRAKYLIFCQGVSARQNPWFSRVKFRPAKGEILTLRLPGLNEHRTIHGGVWLAHWQDDLYRCGATYGWKELDDRPTPSGREEILSRLRAFYQGPLEVVDHVAAVRPILLNQYPALGWHPDAPRIGFLNGLGSKGTLQAPWLAEHLANSLQNRAALDPELNILRRTDLRGCRP